MYITAISYTYVVGHLLSIYSTKLSVLIDYLDDIYNLDMSRDMGFPAMWSKNDIFTISKTMVLCDSNALNFILICWILPLIIAPRN